MHFAGFLLSNEDKLSQSSRSRVLWTRSSSSQLTAAGLPASQEEVTECIVSKVHSRQLTEQEGHGWEESWINEQRWGQVSESWHLKWRTGYVMGTHKLRVRISHCRSSLFPPLVQEVWCAVFFSQVEVEMRDRKHSQSLAILLSHWQGMKKVNSPPPPGTHTHTHRHSFPLTGVEDRHDRGSGTATVTE